MPVTNPMAYFSSGERKGNIKGTDIVATPGGGVDISSMPLPGQVLGDFTEFLSGLSPQLQGSLSRERQAVQPLIGLAEQLSRMDSELAQMPLDPVPGNPVARFKMRLQRALHPDRYARQQQARQMYRLQMRLQVQNQQLRILDEIKDRSPLANAIMEQYTKMAAEEAVVPQEMEIVKRRIATYNQEHPDTPITREESAMMQQEALGLLTQRVIGEKKMDRIQDIKAIYGDLEPEDVARLAKKHGLEGADYDMAITSAKSGKAERERARQSTAKTQPEKNLEYLQNDSAVSTEYGTIFSGMLRLEHGITLNDINGLVGRGHADLAAELANLIRGSGGGGLKPTKETILKIESRAADQFANRRWEMIESQIDAGSITAERGLEMFEHAMMLIGEPPGLDGKEDPTELGWPSQEQIKEIISKKRKMVEGVEAYRNRQ